MRAYSGRVSFCSQLWCMLVPSCKSASEQRMCLVLVQCLCGCVSVHEVPLVFLGSYFGFRREAGFVLVKVCGFLPRAAILIMVRG